MNGKFGNDADVTRSECVERLLAARADAVESLQQAHEDLNRLATWLGGCPQAIRAAQLSPEDAREQAQSCVSLAWLVQLVMKRLGGAVAVAWALFEMAA